MKQREIEFVAHQLSKITENLRYHFPSEYYENSNDFGFLNRNMDMFFDDAKNYIKAVSSDEYLDVYFTLRFFDYESYMTAFKLLEYFDYIIDEEDEKNYTVNEETGLFEFFVVANGSNVHEFIYGTDRSNLSLLQLSKIINTPILFKYENESGVEIINADNGFFSVENGCVELSGTLEFSEITSLDDLPNFNWQIRNFISLFPTFKNALVNNISLKGASSN